MPELPEVEITRRGIETHIVGKTITQFVVRNSRLRWPIPASMARRLAGVRIDRVERRAKYLLLRSTEGTLIIHLGMSGSLRVLESSHAPGPHDHVDLVFEQTVLRLRDPRRFGAVLWQPGVRLDHKLLLNLGPEPLGDSFTAEHLYRVSRGRKVAIKVFLMNSAVVVGVGNIYASEALFRAGIHPATAAGKISRARYGLLVEAVRNTLRDALAAGGSTLRDFVNSDGKRGYFQQQRLVYDREGEACRTCRSEILSIRQGQRSTFFCRQCQRR